MLAVEIDELSKIVSLGMEEKKIKKEIKESHSRLLKNLYPANNNPNVNNTDISETRNDILQELNNILSAEGEKTQKNNKTKTIDANAIEEEHHENNQTNSLMNENENEGEENNIENKNLKCKQKVF